MPIYNPYITTDKILIQGTATIAAGTKAVTVIWSGMNSAYLVFVQPTSTIAAASFWWVSDKTAHVAGTEYAVDANTVGLWHCNDGAGTTLTDATGNHNGTFKAAGEPAWTTDCPLGTHAIDLDGNNDYVSVADHADFDINTFTIEAWVKRESNMAAATFPGIFSKGSNQYFLMCTPTTCTLKGFVWIGSTWYIIESVTALALNTWTHVAFTYDPSLPNNNMKIYINGVLDKQQTQTGNIDTDNYDVFIGSYWYPASEIRTFDGKIDEVRLSNIARTTFNTTPSTQGKFIINTDANVTNDTTFDYIIVQN